LPTAWRCVVPGPDGDRGPEAALTDVRLSLGTGRTERALVAAVAKDEVGQLVEISSADHDLSPVAQLLVGLRQAGSDPMGSSRALVAVLDEDPPPWEHRFIRKHLPDLQVCVVLAPGVPAVIPISGDAVALLVAELLTTTGRHLDAAPLLANLHPRPEVVLALAAVHLASGHHAAAVEITERIANTDDLSALCLVARGVALRVGGRFDEALAALDQAMGDPNRHPGIIVAALGERADLLKLIGDDLAAQADIDRITALEGGEPVADLSAATTSPGDGAREVPMPPPDDAGMAEAREWARRRLTGLGTPGTFAGRHHRSYEADVEAMLSAGQFGTAEHLLLGLLDAVEDEADELHVPIDPSYFRALIDLLEHEKRHYEALAIRERMSEAIARCGEAGSDEPITEPHRARV
jgi:tetratricopeptide (TPR) repeat protein